MAMKPIKLKDLLTQTKKPVTQQIEIMEDYVLSVKTVFEGAVKDVPEDKQFTAESIERNLLSYEPSWLEECYKAVDIKSFAAQFWGRYNFTRESSTMRNEYDFGGAQRSPYTT